MGVRPIGSAVMTLMVHLQLFQKRKVKGLGGVVFAQSGSHCLVWVRQDKGLLLGITALISIIPFLFVYTSSQCHSVEVEGWLCIRQAFEPLCCPGWP